MLRSSQTASCTPAHGFPADIFMHISNIKYPISNRGFSLIELLVFVSIFSLFFVIAISVMTVSLKNLKTNEHRIVATRYAEELLEWMKGEKEQDWNAFYARASGGGSAYCFNGIDPNWTVTSPCAEFNGITGSTYPSKIYKRDAVLTQASTFQVDVTITVSWMEGTRLVTVPLNSSLTLGQ